MSSWNGIPLFGIFVGIIGILGGSSALAQPFDSDPPPGVTELIVLLKAGPGYPTPEEIVADLQAGLVPEGGIGEGNPRFGELAISRRAIGRELEWNQANPDSSSARLQRYVTLGAYPSPVSLRAIANSLSNNPHVDNVEYNIFLTLSLTPSDAFLGLPGQSPDVSQWGLHLMNFPAAWDWSVGHGIVGIVDNGMNVFHLDMASFFGNTFTGGNFRDHQSIDLKVGTTPGAFDCNVEELEDPFDSGPLGHGMITSGIIAANTDNAGEGVAGACWMCSLMMARATDQSNQIFVNDLADAIDFLVNNGSQVISLSAGVPNISCTEPLGINTLFICDAIAMMEERDVVMVAASGNDSEPRVHFPAIEPEVLAVGGVEFSSTAPDGYVFWEDGFTGSNYGPSLDVVAAVKTYSTAYTGHDWLPTCGDSSGALGTSNDGFGTCTGTSVSGPHVTGEVGIARSIEPWLPNAAVRDIVVFTSSHASSPDAQLAFGVPDVEKAVKKALGEVGGETLPNRLTPLLGLHRADPLASVHTHVATTVPSFANSLLLIGYETQGVEVPGRDDFPGPPCESQSCPPELIPRAISYIFTTSNSPYSGSPALVPLYRLSLDPNREVQCNEQPGSILHFAYATNVQDMMYLRDEMGYELDGIEGFVFETCDAACAATGAVPLQLLFNPNTQDFLLALEGQGESGYGPPADAGINLPLTLAFVYPPVDTDSDLLIDGFENLIQTSSSVADTDCDSVSDGEELLFYNLSDPNPLNHGYGDPLLGSCIAIFADSFESGGVTKWSLARGTQ